MEDSSTPIRDASDLEDIIVNMKEEMSSEQSEEIMRLHVLLHQREKEMEELRGLVKKQEEEAGTVNKATEGGGASNNSSASNPESENDKTTEDKPAKEASSPDGEVASSADESGIDEWSNLMEGDLEGMLRELDLERTDLEQFQAMSLQKKELMETLLSLKQEQMRLAAVAELEAVKNMLISVMDENMAELNLLSPGEGMETTLAPVAEEEGVETEAETGTGGPNPALASPIITTLATTPTPETEDGPTTQGHGKEVYDGQTEGEGETEREVEGEGDRRTGGGAGGGGGSMWGEATEEVVEAGMRSLMADQELLRLSKQLDEMRANRTQLMAMRTTLEDEMKELQARVDAADEAEMQEQEQQQQQRGQQGGVAVEWCGEESI